MKQTFILLCALLLASAAQAQEQVDYYLPQTQLQFQLIIERSTYTPGEFAVYAERYLKRSAPTEPSTTYRIVGVSMRPTSVADPEKHYSLPVDKKHTIFKVEKDANGVLLAINAPAPQSENSAKTPQLLQTAPKNSIDPHDYMSEEILTATSRAKMAELTAREIYDIRSSRNELNRGEAEYMPKDGEQLRIMLANLDRQESILLQTFNGVTLCDTLTQDISFLPVNTSADGSESTTTKRNDVLFRFSTNYGLLDADDLRGAPYYIAIDDLDDSPALPVDDTIKKKAKEQTGVAVNMPGRVRARIINNNRVVALFETYAAQYGTIEYIPETLFTAKYSTRVQLSPATGLLQTLEYEPL